MAGIGFELKKVFKKKGILAAIRAYGYAGIVCTGPMILGEILLLGLRFTALRSGAAEEEIRLVNSLVTYTLLASLMITNIFSLVTTRYTADMLYREKKERVMPSYWGSVSIMLVMGWVLYGAFLLACHLPLAYVFLSLILLSVLILVWTQVNYLTAIKDYRGILITFAASVAGALILGQILRIFTGIPIVILLLFIAVLAYGVMAFCFHHLLLRYFPRGDGSSLYFMSWFDDYPQLGPLGFFIGLGLFGHIMVMWHSGVARQVAGLLYETPVYDIPALLAFLSILVTTINFVTSVEVNFYPRYRNYFSLFNDGGSLRDIEQSQKEMVRTLVQELGYTAMKQFFVTVVFVVAGTLLLPYLPLGMTEDMLGIYRVLCCGYAFYAVGNCLMLIQLYFSDNRGALISGGSFAASTILLTLICRHFGIRYYGMGFALGSLIFTLVALFLLWYYLSHLMERVLCSQPVVARKYEGICRRIAERAEAEYRKGKKERYMVEDLPDEEEEE
ncbi:MAG: exopolysaccharide Pel transporter PelG [Lachnospiraceae bacterium]|nr:exopolysaccharide Pel transporter PelG [Lachnospiraceae bacterium]